MEKVLYDKINKRIANAQWFVDQDGFYWVDTDPNGVQISGNVTIRPIKDNDPKYEVINQDKYK